jgi:DNA-binding NarL/FixJ family response regulator
LGALRSENEIPERIVLLSDFWDELQREGVVVVDHFCSLNRCHAVLSGPAGATAFRPASPADPSFDLLLQIVLGRPQKVIALERGISSAAVTLRAQRCLRRLGLAGRLSLLPLFVVMAGIAFDAGPGFHWVGRRSRRDFGEARISVYSFERPDHVLPALLSEAEQEVSRLLVEGCSRAEIAARRGTTPRTAANQIGSVFAKLGVSGRLDLVRSLVERSRALVCSDHSGQQ